MLGGPAKTAEPINLPFGLWTRVGERKHTFNSIRQVAPICPYGMAHCLHMTNTIEPSVCGGDAALCLIKYFDHLLLLGRTLLQCTSNITPPLQLGNI